MKIHSLQQQRYGKRPYFPIVAILAAVATLILLLVFYTSRNLTLARQRLEDSLLQEGLTLIRAIEAGNRAGMRMHWVSNQLQVLVEEIGAMPKVAYIRVIGTDGKVMAHSQSENIEQLSGVEERFLQTDTSKIVTQTITSDTGADIFEITIRIPHHSSPEAGQPGMGMGRGNQSDMGNPMGMGMMRRMQEESSEFGEMAVIQIGMNMSELQNIQQRDLWNAILMFIILSVVGSAALYFILFTQNYHAVNQAFQTMKSYTQHVVDSMANGLISLDTEGRIVTMNRQARHVLVIPQQESMEGKGLEEVIHLHDLDIEHILTQGNPVIEHEVRCTTLAQTTIPLSLSASTLTDDAGNQLGTVLLFRDLSDVRALQEQVKRAERLASVGRLAAGVAHEIRNPLGALKGFLQYFQRKLPLQDQDKTYLTVMMKEVDRLNSVISSLLDFARPKEPNPELCDIGDLIHHVLTLTESDVQSKGIGITLNIAKNLPQISLDRDQMTQVLLNVVLNAVQMMESGGQITIGATIRTETRQFELIISDTGKGIKSEDLSKVFDPFFTTKKQGSGLGLAIAYTIIEQHQGEIIVESEEGKGSTFRIRLPI